MRFTIPFSLFAFQTLALLPAVGLTGGCSDGHVEPAERSGTLSLALTATSSSGSHYRLDGTFSVAGPDLVALNAQDDQPTLTQSLHVGSYESTLQSGWQLLRQAPGGDWKPVQATLLSDAALPFEIQGNAVTHLAYRFLAGQDVVVFDTGTLEIAIEVAEAQAGSGSGAGCVADSDCAGGTCALGICGTLVPGGVLASDVNWTLAGSPYVLGGLLQVGGTLTIEAGAEVFGKSRSMQIHGHLVIDGSSEQPVTLHDVNIEPRGTPQSTISVEIAHALFDGGSPYYSGSASYGSLSLRDSVLTGTHELFLWYPQAPCFIERNVFLQAGGISTGTRGPINITNNYFFEQTTAAVSNWASYSATHVQVHGNTFASSDRMALALLPQSVSAAIDGTGNYWGTTDPTQIGNMISDRNDDLNIASVIAFDPPLAAPAPETPTPPTPVP